MSAEIIQLRNFRFNSLRKYMQPFYASLNMELEHTQEQRNTIIANLIPRFFTRMRSYRNLSLETLSNKSGIPLDHLNEYENGKRRFSKDAECCYLKFCNAYDEYHYFILKIEEFKDPSKRISREALAPSLLAKTGIKIPTIDYSQLKTTKGKVLEFKRSCYP